MQDERLERLEWGSFDGVGARPVFRAEARWQWGVSWLLPGGSLPSSRGNSKKSSLGVFQRHSATVVAVSIFHCQKRYSASVIYIDFLVFFSL